MVGKKSWRDYSTNYSDGNANAKSTDKQKTGTWRNYSKSLSGEKPTQGSWRDYATNDTGSIVGSNVVNRVNKWLQNHNSYISDYQKRYEGRKYSYEDAYVSDSADWLDTVSKQKSDFDAEADSIFSYIDQYKDYLDQDWIDDVKYAITSARGTQNQIVISSRRDNEWWNSFGSEELVSQYGSAEEAYKASQRYDGYSKKYTGMTSDELYGLVGNMDDGEEKEWLTSYAASVDYDEKSKLDVTTAEAEITALEAEIEELDDYVSEALDFLVDYTPGTSEYDAQATKWFGKYGGNVKAMESFVIEKKKQLEEKKRYLADAKRVQYGIKLAGVADSTSEYYDPEFSQHTKYINDGKYTLIPDYKDIIYDEINKNTDSGSYAVGQAWGRISDSEIDRLQAVKYMSEDEVALYNYYYNKHGYDAAEEYLDSIMDKLNALHGQAMFAPMENKWLLEQLFGIVAGLDQFNSGIKNLFSEDDYIPTSAVQYASGLVREDMKDVDLKWYNFKEGKWDDAKIFGNSLGQGIYDLTTTTANMAPSMLASYAVGIINPAAGAIVGNTLMGASAAGNAYADALNRGFGKDEARTYGTAIGVSEALLQQVLGGIGKLGGASSKITKAVAGIDKAILRFSLQYGGKIASEALEEGLQEILDPIFQNAILGTDEKVDWDAVAYSALLGGLSAGTLEFKGTIKQTRTEQALKKKYGGNTEALIQEGLESDINSESYELAARYKAKTDSGKSLTGAEIRQLLSANQEQITPKDLQKIKKAAEKRLTDLGQTEDVSKIAELATKRATGQKLSKSEKSILANSQYGARVANELLPENIDSEGYTTEWAEEIGTKSVNAEAYNKKKIEQVRSILDAMANAEDPATYKSLEERVGKEERLNVSESRQATIRESGDAISLDKKVEVAEFITDKETGKVTDMVLKVDGKEVKASEIDYADEDQSYLFSAVRNIENITPADATAIIRDYDPDSGLTVGEYLNGIDEGFTYGYHGYSEADMKAGNFTTKLSDEQAKSAYVLGQNAKKFSNMKKTEAIKRMRTAVEAEAEKAKAEGKEAPKANKMTITYNHGGGNVVDFDKAGLKGLTTKQKAAPALAQVMHEMGLGTNFELYSSYLSKTMKDKKGNPLRVRLNENGAEEAAPSGIYRKSDGTVCIDLNAYNGKHLTLDAMSHELTHFIQQWSDTKYHALADFLIKTYEKTDMSMHQRVLREQARLKGIRGKEVSYNEAFDEVVANAMSKMLADGKVMERLNELKAQDMDLAQKLWEGLKKLLNKFFRVYENESALFHDAADLMELKAEFEQMKQMWAEAFVEASENYRASLTISESQTFTEADKTVGEQLSEHDFDDTLNSHLNLTQDIYYPKTAREMSVFNRQYINKTNGLKPGKIRYITIYTGSNVYAVRACGTDGLNPYIGKIISNETLEDHYLTVAREELRYGFNENRKGNDSPSDKIRYNRRRGNVSYRSVKERLKAEGNDHLLEDESSGLRDGDRGESGRDSREVKSAGEVYSSQETDFDTEVDSSVGNENKLRENHERGEESDNRRVREGAAEDTEDPRANGERHSDHFGDAQENKGWGNLSASARKRITSIVDNHISSSQNYEEIFGLLCGLANKSADEITATQLRKAIRKITEKIYAEAVATHPVLFENNWSFMGETSRLRKDILDAAKADSNDGEVYSSHETDFDQDFDYFGWNWATELGIITAKDRAIFERTINNEIFRGAEPQSADGEYIIDTGKCLMFTDGDFHRPTLSRVIEFATEYESLTADAKEMIYNEAKAAGDLQESLSAIERMFGQGFVRVHNKPNGGTHGGQIRGRKGSNRNGTAQKAKSLKERLAEEGLSHLLEEDEVYSSQETDLDANKEKVYSYEGLPADAFYNEDYSYIYSYDFLTAQKDMTIVDSLPTLHELQTEGKIDSAKVLAAGYKNILEMGGTKIGDTYSIINTYTNRPLQIGKNSITHGLGAEDINAKRTNARLAAVIGELCKNAIPICALPNTHNVRGTYGMAVLVNSHVNGKDMNMIALITVEQQNGNVQSVDFVDVAHAVSGRLVRDIEKENRSAQGTPPGTKSEWATRFSSTLKITQFLDIVNRTHQGYLSDDVISKLGEERRGPKKALFSTQETDNISNRDLLANAFEGITKGSAEHKLIQEYKNRIKLLNEQEEKLSKLNAEIRKIRFGTTGARDTARLAQLEAEAKNTAKAINRHDKKLLSLEASEPLRKVIERERKKEAQKTKDHVKEIQQNKKVRAEQTELRHKIRKAIRDLDKLLNRGNKKQNVKEDVQNVVSTALKAADILFTDNYGSYDMLRNGIGTDLSDDEEALVKTCAQMLKDLDKMPTDGYENWQARQEAENRLRTKMSKLKEVFARERKRLNNTTVSSILGELADAYAKLDDSEQSYVQGAYSEPVHNFLKNLQSEVGGTIVKDMTKNQLESVYAAYKMVLNTVRNANKMFNEELKQSREQLGNAVIEEVLKTGGVHLLGTKMGDAVSQFDWNNMKPIWVGNRIGSETFGKLMNGLFKGQYNFAVDIDEVKQFKLSMDEKYHPRNWEAEKQYEFESSSGKKFSLNLQQIMSLYAFSKREQAYSHLLNGGFVFEDNSTVVVDGKLGIKRTYIHKGATSYKLNEATLNGIINSLTAEQKAYVDEMQKYLSDVMGAKGNEVSMQMYGIRMFKEKFYFPLRSSGAYMERAKEAEMKKQQGQINLVNSGFTHSVKPEAKNPIILSGFMDVWAEHCNEMSMYHSMVLPMEDFRKVYNYSTIHDEKMESASVFQTIQDAYGKAATSYIDQLYRELNAGATVDPRETPWKNLISNFKKSAVMLSGSVVVQQFSSIGRAYAIIDPKYFIGTKVNSDTSLSVVEEMKKYAPVAIIKEMGGFDTGTKGGAKSYIMAEQYGKGERIKGFLKDKQYRDDIMGFMPQWADQKTWCAIWEATKRETKAKHSDMDVKSEEFLKLAGERFSEIIEKTQVYDSVLARSANMRSKGNFMAMATAFMAEPTTTVNLIEDAIRSGNAKHIARAFGSVAVSIVLNNALASIVYAMRDDDEDETFIEKYFQSFTSGMVDDINPISYYPFLKDVWALFQGYDVERSDMSVIADVRDALKQAYTLLSKDTSNLDDNELAEHNKSIWGALMSVLDAGCSAFGVPVKNVRRDATGIINAFSTIGKDLSGERDNSWFSFWDKVGAAAKDTIPIYAWTKDKAKTDKLYDAIVSGDEAYLGRLKSTYKTEDAYQSAVRKALRENDPRIKAAAQARYVGNTEEYKRIFREIQKEGKFTFDDIMSAINTELSKLTPDKVTSDYTASGYVEAIAMGNTSEAQVMKNDIIATKVANGKTQEEAEKEFASSVATGIRDAYSSGLLDEARAEEMLMEYTDMDEEEAASKVSYWSFQDEHPEYKDVFTESHVEKYHEFAEPADISVDVYAQFINGTKGLTDIKDEWGDVEVTKREQVLEVIDSLPLTWQQKDALYLAAGYSESKIWDVPW